MSKKPYPSETADRFIVRLPNGMRDRIADVAKANGRSMNAEIVYRLENSLFSDGLRRGVDKAGGTPTMHEIVQTAALLTRLIQEKEDADIAAGITNQPEDPK